MTSIDFTVNIEKAINESIPAIFLSHSLIESPSHSISFIQT